MDFDAQGVYADLDGAIHFLRLLEGIWLKVKIVKLFSKFYRIGLDVVHMVWAFALVPTRMSITRLLVLQGLLCVGPHIYFM